jgi:hypothetical protein
MPGLQPLAFACPYAAGVEIAVGPEGGLHLLTLDCAPAEQTPLARLTTAGAWARDHLPLLRSAAASCPLSDAPAVLHLFTTNAASIRRLGDSGIRLHVLVSVKAGDRLAWACADLN